MNRQLINCRNRLNELTRRKYKMSQDKKKMPICQLQLNEPMTPKMQHSPSVAEMNNFRGNYQKYSHYRKEKTLNSLPTIHSRRCVSRSSSSRPSSRRSVYLILQSPQRAPSGGHITPVEIAAFRSKTPGDRSVSIPSSQRGLNEDVQSYEVTGTQIHKSSEGIANRTCSQTSDQRRPVSQTSHPRSVLQRQQSGSSVNNTKRGTKYGMTPDMTEVSLGGAVSPLLTSRSGCHIRFKEVKVANIQSYILPVRDDNLRVGTIQRPYKLTAKNLEIFNCYGRPVVDGPDSTTLEVPEYEDKLSDPRVYQWIRERQVQACIDYTLAVLGHSRTSKYSQNKQNIKDDSVNGNVSNENHNLNGDSPINCDTTHAAWSPEQSRNITGHNHLRSMSPLCRNPLSNQRKKTSGDVQVDNGHLHWIPAQDVG